MLIAIIVTIGVLVGVPCLIVAVSGRTKGKSFTGSTVEQVDYDHPYRGSGLFQNGPDS